MENGDVNFDFMKMAAEVSGVPEQVIIGSFSAYVILYLIIIITGITVWISKCYNRSIIVSILGSLMLVFWVALYGGYAGSSLASVIEGAETEEDANEFVADAKQKLAIFIYILVILAGLLSYGFYRQVTGKCGLFG